MGLRCFVCAFAPVPRKCYTPYYTSQITICNLQFIICNLQSIRGCMSARKKRWVLRDPAPADFIASLHDQSPLAATLLYQRGLRDESSIAAFLSTDYKRGMHDPFLLKGMDAAARRVAAAIAEGEPIAVYGDFHTDGVTAVTLLIQRMGAMDLDIRTSIPD